MLGMRKVLAGYRASKGSGDYAEATYTKKPVMSLKVKYNVFTAIEVSQ